MSITWINHSYNHRARKSNSPWDNFMLRKGTDFDEEVLENEKLMIEYGVVPSVFFRFPGLYSGEKVFKKIMEYGLIPVGCDSWIAKGQYPRAGSIVLVHANGNEPIGIKRFIHLLESKKKSILKKHWIIYDIRERVSSENEDDVLNTPVKTE